MCPYHNWTYATDGRLVAASHMAGSAVFDKAACGLPSYRLESWRGFLCVNLDDDAAPLQATMASMDRPTGTHYRIDEQIRGNHCARCPGAAHAGLPGRRGRAVSAVTVVDGVGRQVTVPEPPRRIVSLVPSTTETLAELGLAERVVGRTRYCVHPRPWVEGVPTVGGTKDVDVASVAALEPDLIVGNEEENRPELWAELEALAPLYVAFPRDVDEALDDLTTLARLAGVAGRGVELVDAIRRERSPVAARFSYVYLIWRKPWRAAGPDTYLTHVLAEVGGDNALTAEGPGGAGRYPELTLDELVALDPDRVLLSSEPYPFAAGHAAELGPLAGRCLLVDGEMACWHGARMLQALPYLRERLADAGR